MTGGEVRWAILGTANIARASFLPGLREAGGGRPELVAGRELAPAEEFARREGVGRAVLGYAAALEDPSVDAVYIALPNSLHAEWTKRALAAGKAVLTEKPLCLSPGETQGVLQAAWATGALLWEAFVFPFQAQFRRLGELLAEGAIGELREIQSDFHFRIRAPNIRLEPELGGGALNDVGCYPLHLGSLLLGGRPTEARAARRLGPEGVDMETQGLLRYPGGGTLLFSCGMARPYDTFTRLLGSAGEIRLQNPFHPGPADALELRAGGGVRVEHPTVDEHSFSAALRHVHAVLRGECEPEQLAVETALPTAQALELVRGAAISDLHVRRTT